jgi:hypothetical protein
MIQVYSLLGRRIGIIPLRASWVLTGVRDGQDAVAMNRSGERDVTRNVPYPTFWITSVLTESAEVAWIA